MPGRRTVRKPERTITMSPRRIATLLGALALAGGAAAPAQAGVLVASATECADADSSRVFLPWADVANYFPAPGGDFEGGDAAWSTTGAAEHVAGNEPWEVAGDGDASLGLAPGSSATSPAVCVGIEHPTIRLFARGTGDPLTSGLRVDALFEDAGGTVRSLTIGRVTPGDWGVTPVYPIVANLLPLLPGEHTPVAFRFTPEGTGSWAIDDVHVDPYGRY